MAIETELDADKIRRRLKFSSIVNPVSNVTLKVAGCRGQLNGREAQEDVSADSTSRI